MKTSTIPTLLGPDGMTSLREYAGYHGGGSGFGGQLRAWNPPSESVDAALLEWYKRCSCSGIYSFTTGYDRRKLVAVGAALHLGSSSCRVLSSRCTNPVAIRYRSVWLCPDAGADF